MRRLKVVGFHSDVVHEGVSVRSGSFLRVRSSTGVDHTPIQTIFVGTIGSNTCAASISGFLETVEIVPPLRNTTGNVGKVFNTTSLVHVADTFVHTMLAGEAPSTISIFGLLGIPVRVSHKIHNLSN